MDKRRIFTYWVNNENAVIPDYIKMCMETWERHIKDVEIITIDHSNLSQWIDITFDINHFKQLTLPMQSDILSYYVLHKHGGIYMDADTIVFSDIFNEIAQFDKSKIYMFGDKAQNTCHVAFIASLQKNNRALFDGIKKVQSNVQKLFNQQIELTWDLFSNSIYHELIQKYDTAFEILDKYETGAILEHVLQLDDKWKDYLCFYFDNKSKIDLENIVGRIKFGAVLLHNSWTPDNYREASREMILNDGLLISRLLKYALGYPL